MADTSASGADDSNIVQVQVLLSAPAFGFAPYRGVAQFGRALRSGRRGRGFKSRHLDHEGTVAMIQVAAVPFNFSCLEVLDIKDLLSSVGSKLRENAEIKGNFLILRVHFVI